MRPYSACDEVVKTDDSDPKTFRVSRKKTMKRALFVFIVLLALSPFPCFSQQERTQPQSKRILFPIYLEETIKNGSYERSRGWGYISNLGQVLIPLKFTAAGHFSEGLAPVRDSTGDWGYIDEVGDLVIKFQFGAAGIFSGGLARIKLDGKFGFVNKSGRVVINPRFDEAGSFSEGLAAVRIGAKYGYINSDGQRVIQPLFEVANSFSESVAAVRIGNLYGYVDPTGRICIEPQFSEAGSFSEGLAKVKVNSKWGYIDKTGKFVIKPQFDDAGSFREKLAEIKIGTRWGYINRVGNEVISAQFEEAYSFSEGLATVKTEDRWGYINKDGEVTIYPSYLSAKPFYKGVGIVTQMRYETAFDERTGSSYIFRSETWAYIDPKGRVLAQQYRHRENLGASGYGPDFSYANVDIYLLSRPTGAVVYLVPLFEWEKDSDMINDDRKLSPYRVAQGNTDVQTFQPEMVFKAVFVLSGKKVAIDVDVTGDGNRNFKVDFL